MLRRPGSVRFALAVCAPLAVVVSSCGARTLLDTFDVFRSETGGSSSFGGSSSLGGSSSGGASLGGAVPIGGNATGGSSLGGSVGRGGVSGNSGAGGSGGAQSTGGNAGAAAEGGVGGAGGEGGEGTPIVIALALGAFHSCARFDDRTLRCWGSGRYIGSGNGISIGDDETPDVLAPVELGGAALQFDASWYDTCALLDAGRLRCFGDGLSGALGYGNTNTIGDDEAPASAGDVDVGASVRNVSTGPYHTCAVLRDGRLKCWGRNSEWQLGYPRPEAIGDDESPASVGDVDVGERVVDTACGFAHTCALLETGGVRCWGTGSAGRLGYGNTRTIGDDESPASAGDVDLGDRAVQISAGLFHTCALLAGGNVRCWGGAMNGALGYGNDNAIGDDETPASVGFVDIGGPVSEIAAGAYSTCAVLVGGAVRCWGSGENGVLGHGNTETIGDDETPASAGDIDVGGPVSHVAVGFLHVCVMLRSGGVRCWGRGSDGALGYGNKLDIGDDETPASAGDVRLLPDLR